MKRLFTAILVLAFSGAGFAQPDTLWTRTFGSNSSDGGWSVQQTQDGGYIVSGYSNYGAGATDIWLIKTDVNGDSVWTRLFGGWTGEHGFSVQQTQDGGYIVAGLTHSFGAGGGDIYLVKTDVNGDTLWTKTYGGALYDRGQSVKQTQDGGYIIVGYTKSFGGVDEDFWLIKTDADGDTMWTRVIGDFGGEKAYSVQQTQDGGYIITGRTSSFDVGNVDLWLVRTDSDGDTLWTKVFGDSCWDEGRSVQETSDSGFIITGYTESFGAGDMDIWLIKTDFNGDTLWARTFGDSAEDKAYSVKQTSDGGYIVAGTTRSFGAGHKDAWLIRTDAKGNTLWTKTLGGADREEVNDIDITSDGGYIFTGRTASFGGGISDNLWLVKIGIDPAGVEEKENANRVELRLFNYPNPFSLSTVISYQLPVKGVVDLRIYNITGQLIRTLANGTQRVGRHSVTWDGRDEKGKLVSSGTYFLKLEGGDNKRTQKMTMVR